MHRTSYTIQGRHLPYLLLTMFMIIYMIGILFVASVTGDQELILLSFALLAIIGLMILSLLLYKRSD